MCITVTKSFSFCYGHFLPQYDGLCAKQHGHNAKLELSFKQPHFVKTEFDYHQNGIKYYEGMILDFNEIKKSVQPIIKRFDHKNLNDLSEFEFINPTSENLLKVIIGFILSTVIGDFLCRAKLSESDSSYVEWRK